MIPLSNITEKLKMKNLNITSKSQELFVAYWKDAGNWSGTPAVGHNVKSSQENNGNLTQLKIAGLISTWTDERITEAMFREQEKIVTLKKSIPVYVVYFTAFVDEEDRLNFRDDIYKRDEVMKEMIFDKKSKNLVYQR